MVNLLSSWIGPRQTPETKGIKTRSPMRNAKAYIRPRQTPETKGIKTQSISISTGVSWPRQTPETKGIKTHRDSQKTGPRGPDRPPKPRGLRLSLLKLIFDRWRGPDRPPKPRGLRRRRARVRLSVGGPDRPPKPRGLRLIGRRRLLFSFPAQTDPRNQGD